MRILDKYSYWWKKEEKQWATQDKDGNWWIWGRRDKSSVAMKPPSKRRKGQTSNVLTREQFLIIALASALGVSVALNVVAIMS